MNVPTRRSARCRTLLLELSRYLDADLTPARRRTIEWHINACARCGTAAARLRSMIAACRAEGRKTPPRGVLSRAAERIRVLKAREGRRPVAIPQRRSASGPARR
jgi:anti-sigma factor RsiW